MLIAFKFCSISFLLVCPCASVLRRQAPVYAQFTTWAWPEEQTGIWGTCASGPCDNLCLGVN